MQVRSEGAASVPAESHELAAGDFKLFRGRVEVAVVFAAVAQLVFHPFFQFRIKGIQVAVHGGIAFGVSQIKCISIAVRANGDAADIAICYSIDPETAASLSFYIDSSVEVISAQFRESAAQHQWDIQRRARLEILCRGNVKG